MAALLFKYKILDLHCACLNFEWECYGVCYGKLAGPSRLSMFDRQLRVRKKPGNYPPDSNK